MRFFIALLLLFSSFVHADNLSKIAGKYDYEQYHVTLKNGQTLTLGDLGAKSATLEIFENGKITLTMNMLKGNTVSQLADIEKFEFDGKNGIAIEKWPDMNYSVSKTFKYNNDSIEYDIHFTEASDAMRYGSTEHALLRIMQ